MHQSRIITLIYAVLSMLFWGFSYIWVKIAYKYYEPLTTVFIRLVISAVILIVVVKSLKLIRPILKKDYLKFFALAFFEPFCYFLGESFGLKFVSSTIAAVIIATIPVLTPFAILLFFKERITWINFAGIIISFFGVLLMIINKDLSLNASPTGVLLMFVAVFSALGFIIFINDLSHRYNPLTILMIQNTLGALFFLPLFLIFDWQHFVQVKVNYELAYSIICLSIFASTLAFLLFIVVIRNIGATRANLFTNLIPVFTAFFSYFLLNEEFTWFKITGILFVIGGVSLTQGYALMKELKNRRIKS